jgi:diguanylate cyclase
MTEIKSFPSFDAAAQASLKFLQNRLGMDLWMVTRTEGDDWIVLQIEDQSYGVKQGAVFNWVDSFCSRMTRGLGPRIAPRSQEVPAYAAAPIGQLVKIGAYVGIPLTRSDGSLFGTLCAIDPEPQPEALADELPLVELISSLLCSALEAEMKTQSETRFTERALSEQLMDSLTGLYNLRGWTKLATAEEQRCQRFGHPACVLSIDLDSLKLVAHKQGQEKADEYLCRAAKAIRSAVRTTDIVARTGDDKIAVLGIECDEFNVRKMMDRVSGALDDAKMSASIGIATRNPKLSISNALVQADEMMYRCKRIRNINVLSSGFGESEDGSNEVHCLRLNAR